jgi:hypothetical protein
VRPGTAVGAPAAAAPAPRKLTEAEAAAAAEAERKASGGASVWNQARGGGPKAAGLEARSPAAGSRALMLRLPLATRRPPRSTSPPSLQPARSLPSRQAGTFEERNLSRWGEERLRALLVGVAAPGGGPSTTGVATLTGDATAWIVRGKRRVGFEYSEVKLNWAADVGGVAVAGTAALLGASVDDYEDDLSLGSIEVSDRKAERSAAEAAAAAGVKKLLEPLRAALAAFHAELKEK